MEQDLKEGKQDQSPQIVPWRALSHRKTTFDKKVLMHSMLEAQRSGKHLDAFTRPFHDTVVDAYELSKTKRGNMTSEMNQLLKVMSSR